MQKSSTIFIISKFNNILKRVTARSNWIYSRNTKMVKYPQMHVIYQINKKMIKIIMIMSIDTEKSFNKTQHPFMIKTTKIVNLSGVEEISLNIIKAIYKNPTQIATYLMLKI